MSEFRSKITPKARARMEQELSLKEQRKQALESKDDEQPPNYPEPDDADNASLRRGMLT